MATTLALAMRASMSAGGVVSGANQAADAMDKMGRQARKTAADVSTIKNIAIGAVVAKGVMTLANAFTDAGRAAVNYAAGVSQSVDQLNDLSARLGIGVEALQTFNMAAKLSGAEGGTQALQKLGVLIGQAAESGKTEAFEKLGLDFQALQSMSPEEQFRAIQQAISALPTPAERAAAAVAMFGKAGVELLPLMSQNLDEIDARMRRLGAVVGTDQVEAIGQMNDSLDMVKATFDGIIGQVVGNLAPVVTSLAEEFMAFVETFNGISGEGGTGVANAISDALLDIADYFAGIFDSAVENFDGFGVTLQEVGSVFQFVANVFTAVGETLRAGFNMFQISGNLFAIGVGKLLEGLGSWVSQDLQQFGKDMAAKAAEQMQQNSAEGNQALSNAGAAASAAVFGAPAAAPGADGPARRAVRAARTRMNDTDAKDAREAARADKAAQDKAASEASAAQSKSERDAKAAAERAKKAEPVLERAQAKQDDISKMERERAAALGGESNEALKANDVRSSEGMSQFLALASGREDPAIAEYRKQTAKLEEMKAELRALNQQAVDILGAAA
jgi:hypothetical protein